MAQQQTVHFGKEKSMILISGYMRRLDITSKGSVLKKIVFGYYYALTYFHSERVEIDIETDTITSKVSNHDTCFIGDWLDTKSMHSFHFRINKVARYIGIGLSPEAGKENFTPDVCVCAKNVYAFYTSGNAWTNEKEIIASAEPLLTFKAGDEGIVHYDPCKSEMGVTKNKSEEMYIFAKNMIKTKYKWAVSVTFDQKDSLTILHCS